MKRTFTKNYFNKLVIAFAITIFFQNTLYAQIATVSAFVGSSTSGNQEGTGTNASFSGLYQLAQDENGNMYVADVGNYKIRKITPAGVVSTFAGTGQFGNANGPKETATFKGPVGIAYDVISKSFYVVDQSDRTIRKIAADGTVSTFAGSGVAGYADGTGTDATFNNPYLAAVDASGNVFVTDHNNHTIRKITPAGVVTTFAGTAGISGHADGTGTDAVFYYPRGIAFDNSGNLFVTDQQSNYIRKITPAGVVTTLAGNGTQGSTDGAATEASFSFPFDVAADDEGNVYVTDLTSYKIRKITTTGVVSTLAGSGMQGSDDGIGAAASFTSPKCILVNSSGDIFVSDVNKVRKIVLSPVTAVLTADNYQALNIYPNPSQGELNLELEGNKRLVIMDMTGKVQLDEISSANNFSVNALSKGMYLLEVQQGGKTYRSKLLID